jgi:ankyrin repeat protein
VADNWRCLFDDEDYLESRNFPPLHKTILGLVRNNLQQQLEASTSTIDDRDADGFTALHWAAAKGDVDAVNALLEFGATPNMCSRRGHSPLSWASQSPSQRRVEIVQALLSSGADVNQVDFYNRTPLLNAAADLDDPACMQLFIDHGAELNWRDCHKRTPLGYAAKMGNSRNLSILLSHGADPFIPDHWGHTPLSEAVKLNHHCILKILLQYNHTIHCRLASGTSILHLAAAYGDVETLRLLVSGGNFRYLDLEECNAEGLTAQSLFDRRGDDSEPELREAWRVLIETIVRQRGCENEPDQQNESKDDTDSDNGDFVDAYEYQSSEVGST